ncbi:hypothetical protein [Palleronia rufa]|uniref:hypothetical protein n=1 Tax=Palleronia rufa TaxID=1530186 RepID=UPI00068EEBF8|nr:hypothetical protein [Palleronia rufa]
MIPGVMPVPLDAGWVAVLAAFRPDMGPSVQPRDMSPRGQFCLMPIKGAVPTLLPVVGILGSLLAGIATAATGASVRPWHRSSCWRSMTTRSATRTAAAALAAGLASAAHIRCRRWSRSGSAAPSWIWPTS